jgi:L-malate glycosyltransferase
MINICHLISGDLWAGAEVMAFELISVHYNSPDTSVNVVVLNGGTLSQRLREIGIETYVFNEKEFSFFQLLNKICEVLKNRNINIIHSHRYKENLLAFFASIFLPSIRLISTQHGMPENNTHLRSRLIHSLNFILLSHFFTMTVTVSHDIHTIFIKRLRFKNKNTAVIHNGVTLPLLPNVVLKSDAFIIGSAGRFFPIKNYPLMIEIAHRLKNEPGIKFKLAGEGPERLKLEEATKRYKVERHFELCGHQTNMPAFYCQIHIFLNTSFQEGIPMSILEAMSYGIPVIASKTGGILEIIDDGKDGFLVRSDDAEGFADKCFFLFKNTKVREQMGVAARDKIVKSFSIQSCADKYRMIYKKVIKR